MTKLKWNPRKDISKTAYFNGIKGRANWSVETTNKRGKDRLVTIVKYGGNHYDIIIDGAHHKANAFNFERVAALFLGDTQAKRLVCVALNNPAFA